jgi:hypothetical protein
VSAFKWRHFQGEVILWGADEHTWIFEVRNFLEPRDLVEDGPVPGGSYSGKWSTST